MKGKRAPVPLDFYAVPLPAFGKKGDGWSLVREKIAEVESRPNNGYAVTIDSGGRKRHSPAGQTRSRAMFGRSGSRRHLRARGQL